MSEQNKNSYLEQQAYNKIRDMILKGELSSGEKIIQDQIAEKIGVSRTPIRKALGDLDRDYLVEIKPHGIFVRTITDSFIQSIWDVRAVLEGLASRLSVNKVDKPTLAYLRTMFESAYDDWKKGDIEPYFKADVYFHSKLVEFTDNPILERNFETTHIYSITFNVGLVRSPQETHIEHMEILDALEEKNADEAEKLMVDHIRKTRDKIKLNQKQNN